jgi:heavy metal translocating P-type ATPase
MRVWTFLKNNPIPLFVICALAAGVVFAFGFNRGEWAHYIWYAALVLGGLPIVYNTVKGMFKGQFASDIVAMLAIVTAVLLDEAFAGAVVVLMQSGGEAIERYGLRKATTSLIELLSRAPRKARRKSDGAFEEIDASEVKVGDVLLVRPGELIPVDGSIVKGKAQIDESAVTGEPLAREKKEGDRLLSGCVAVDGAFEMRAERLSEESQYAKIVKLVKKAQEEKAPIQRLADRYAVLFTPLALIMAFLGYLITRDTTTILAVLVVATPCPLILATPLAVICGINRAAKEGIIVKGGAPIEQIASAQAALFDKTGTITFGTPSIDAVVSFSEASEEDILKNAAIVEQFSTHSIAKGIVAHAMGRFQKLSLPQNFVEIPGQGVSGEIDGCRFVVGSAALLQAKADRFKEKLAAHIAENKLPVFVLRDGECIGAIILTDRIRPNAGEMVRRLSSLGVEEIVMITGDNEKTAAAIAKEAGIERFHAELLPEEKVAVVEEMRKKYNPLLMVGDGINDAPALATATVGIAMGAHGTAISAEAANIVLLVDDLFKVADAVQIGKDMLRIAKQSIFIGIGLSFLLMAIAAFGYIPPPVGALLQEIIDFAVIVNALRVLHIHK